MAHWLRFERDGAAGFGTLDGGVIAVHQGSMFAGPTPTGERVMLDEVRLLAPAQPAQMFALWNNFRALGTKLGLAVPEEPLFFMKSASSYAGPEAVVHRPAGYTGKVVFEGELAIVIGATCRAASVDEARAAIFGYTCVNDFTAADILNKDPSFAQWTRAKSFDGFSPFGPVIATGLDPDGLVVAEAVTLGDELVVADCDLDACRQGKEKMFNFAAHRRPDQYRRIVDQVGAVPPGPG